MYELMERLGELLEIEEGVSDESTSKLFGDTIDISSANTAVESVTIENDDQEIEFGHAITFNKNSQADFELGTPITETL